MVYVTAANGDVGITLYNTCINLVDGTLTSTIDVTVSFTGIHTISITNSTFQYANIGIIIHASQFTATINRLANSDRMGINVIANRHLRATSNRCRQTIATTKDIAHDSTVIDVYYRIFLIGVCLVFIRIVLYRIGSLVTTAIYAMVNSTAIDIDRYRILRSTQYIVTAKDVVDATTFHRHGNRTIDVSSMITLCSFVVFTQATSMNITSNGTTIEVNVSVTICSKIFLRILRIWICISIDTAVVC